MRIVSHLNSLLSQATCGPFQPPSLGGMSRAACPVCLAHISIQGAISAELFSEPRSSKRKDRHAQRECWWQLKSVTPRIVKHSQVKAEGGRSRDVAPTSQAQLRVGVGRFRLLLPTRQNKAHKQSIAGWTIFKCCAPRKLSSER